MIRTVKNNCFVDQELAVTAETLKSTDLALEL